jgi:chloramphenicol-sensitive protein RarD
VTRPSEARAALIAGAGCYAIWGFIPLVFQAMAGIGADAWEIMAHRMVWSVILAAALVSALGQWEQVTSALRDRRTLFWLILSTLLIAVNWTTYVMAVNGGRTLDASLGYYLNPLLNMAAGAWLFRERLSRAGLIAIGLAAVGVALQAAALGHLPWVSLLLGFSFCAYGIIRKKISVDAGPGLFVECLILAAPGLAWVVWLTVQGVGHFGQGAPATLWLLAAGPATVVPMAMFAWAARRMPYSTMGFLQFLAPSIVFVIGALQGEPLGALRLVSFAFIWAGAIMFAVGALSRKRGEAAEAAAAPEPGLVDDPAEERARP